MPLCSNSKKHSLLSPLTQSFRCNGWPIESKTICDASIAVNIEANVKAVYALLNTGIQSIDMIDIVLKRVSLPLLVDSAWLISVDEM